jgi:F-type H+-transporting ATPase subunit epsilon
MEITFMNLKILLPFLVYADKSDVKRIVAETPQGSFGILPQRLDCTAALAPGILTYDSESEGEVILAIDEGILVKAGKDVFISVRNAIGGASLGQLHEAVNREFVNIDEREKNVRSIMAKLEIGFIRRLDEFRKK